MSVYGGSQGFGTGGTGMSGPMMGSPGPNEHETVGAYALGLLDDVEATAFEAHLATCEWCAQQLDELSGMEPMLAALADLPGSGTPGIGESLSTKPSPRLVNNLVDEVSERRAQKRRKSFYMVAAAAALIIGGPIAAVAVNGGDSGGGTGELGKTTVEPASTATAPRHGRRFPPARPAGSGWSPSGGGMELEAAELNSIRQTALSGTAPVNTLRPRARKLLLDALWTRSGAGGRHTDPELAAELRSSFDEDVSSEDSFLEFWSPGGPN
ncbi:hypothetical protein SALBM311S_05213 [Streptomyces alboniger]